MWIIPGRIIPAMRLRKAGRYTITSTQASMISIFAKSRKRQEQTKRKKSMLIKSSVTATHNKMVSQYNLDLVLSNFIMTKKKANNKHVDQPTEKNNSIIKGFLSYHWDQVRRQCCTRPESCTGWPFYLESRKQKLIWCLICKIIRLFSYSLLTTSSINIALALASSGIKCP